MTTAQKSSMIPWHQWYKVFHRYVLKSFICQPHLTNKNIYLLSCPSISPPVFFHCISALTPGLCSWWTVVHLKCPHHLSPPMLIQFTSALLLLRTLLVTRSGNTSNWLEVWKEFVNYINEKSMISSSFRIEWIWERTRACPESVFWVSISKSLP